jgi:hypothetical protein
MLLYTIRILTVHFYLTSLSPFQTSIYNPPPYTVRKFWLTFFYNFPPTTSYSDILLKMKVQDVVGGKVYS